ncbi:hypothetical protein TCON_2466 [Astathelohania contejeani]|uniref:Uncharacterized protein n=1 Tax=Astathelohania contejeani TaxID=164912 RepID=A0ABQ7HW03_9MICR|nr:hypothetical protein TCON_2466 [Thelohania contejeani]
MKISHHIPPPIKNRRMEDEITLINTSNFRLDVKICNYHKIYPQFNIDKIVGIFNFSLRYNLIRYLVFLEESEKYDPFDSDDVYAYSPHLNKREMIFKKIYDMSGLIYKDKLFWGLSLCAHYAYDITNDDKEKIGKQISSSDLNIIYRNRVVDLWLFLLSSMTPKASINMQISLINATIGACLLSEEVHKREEEYMKKPKTDYIYIQIIIQTMLKFDEKILNYLINHYMNEVIWSEATEISHPQAQKMHYDLINQFAIITTIFRQLHPIHLLPHNTRFEKAFIMNQLVSEVLAYHSGEGDDDDVKYFIYDRQYKDFDFNSNGIIQRKIMKKKDNVNVVDENEEGKLETEKVEPSILAIEENIKFNTKKLVGLDNLPLRQNLIRLLFINYKRKGHWDNSRTYSYAPNLDTWDLIFQKIYDMSGLLFNKKLDWGMCLCNNYNCDIKENIDSLNPFFSRLENIYILYINRVIDLWIFLLQPILDSDNLKLNLFLVSSVKNLTIRNCITYENICKENNPNQAVPNLPMYIIIQHMLDFNDDTIEALIDHFMEQDIWSKLRTISLPLAMQMHCDLLNQFILITKREKCHIKIPPNSKFILNFSNNCKVAEMVAYHSGKGANIDIYNNQYRNYTINNNGIITSLDSTSSIFSNEGSEETETEDEIEEEYICEVG